MNVNLKGRERELETNKNKLAKFRENVERDKQETNRQKTLLDQITLEQNQRKEEIYKERNMADQAQKRVDDARNKLKLQQEVFDTNNQEFQEAIKNGLTQFRSNVKESIDSLSDTSEEMVNEMVSSLKNLTKLKNQS